MSDRDLNQADLDVLNRPIGTERRVPLAGRLWLDFLNMSETTAASLCILIAIVGTLALKGIGQ